MWFIVIASCSHINQPACCSLWYLHTKNLGIWTNSKVIKSVKTSSESKERFGISCLRFLTHVLSRPLNETVGAFSEKINENITIFRCHRLRFSIILDGEKYLTQCSWWRWSLANYRAWASMVFVKYLMKCFISWKMTSNRPSFNLEARPFVNGCITRTVQLTPGSFSPELAGVPELPQIDPLVPCVVPGAFIDCMLGGPLLIPPTLARGCCAIPSSSDVFCGKTSDRLCIALCELCDPVLATSNSVGPVEILCPCLICGTSCRITFELFDVRQGVGVMMVT